MNKLSIRFASKLLAEPFGPRHGRGGRFGHPVLLLLGLVVVAILVVVSVALIRKGRQQPAPAAPQAAAWTPASPAEAILAERFARGEVSVEEFSVARSALRGEWVPVGSGAPMTAPSAPGSPIEPAAP